MAELMAAAGRVYGADDLQAATVRAATARTSAGERRGARLTATGGEKDAVAPQEDSRHAHADAGEHGGDRGVEDAVRGEQAPVDGVVEQGRSERQPGEGQEQAPAGSRLPRVYVRGMSHPLKVRR